MWIIDNASRWNSQIRSDSYLAVDAAALNYIGIFAFMSVAPQTIVPIGFWCEAWSRERGREPKSLPQYKIYTKVDYFGSQNTRPLFFVCVCSEEGLRCYYVLAGWQGRAKSQPAQNTPRAFWYRVRFCMRACLPAANHPQGIIHSRQEHK